MNAPSHAFEAPAAAPRVFARAITVPGFFPWDQARAAEMEARMGSPARIDELDYRITRLEPWAPGRPGRFAALYVRAGEAPDGFVANTELDGRFVSVRFASREAEAKAARSRLIILGGALALSLILAGALISAVAARTDREARLGALEERATVLNRQTQRLAAAKAQARRLAAASAGARSLTSALADIDWAARARNPEAHFQALHWQDGMMTLEVRGTAPPFTSADRDIRKAERPLGPGLWLWGVGPVAPSASSSPAGALRP